MTEAAPHTARSDAVAADSKGRALFRIQTFTARYDPVEDRIRFDAVNAQGGKQAIFLTRRLTDRVIPVLVSHLEGKTPEGVPADLAQCMSQSRARQARKTGEETPAVAVDAGTPNWLCRTVHVQKAQQGLKVIFTDDTQTDAVMPMVEANLRAMLDILLDLYGRASWPTEPFPEWMSPEATVTISRAQGRRLN
jgi:hypothetical protein